ncbi:MAG TPA: glycoside hydrolase family 2 protein [Actinopolymorphaceae bacterium]
MRGWRDLHEGWKLQLVDEEPARADGVPATTIDAVTAGIDATVPGCVHTDLLAAGLIPDPYLDRHENQLRWIGRSDWRYTTTFAWQPGEEDRADLVCDGLDTVARIELNGVEVGRTQNMHRSYRWSVRNLLRPGDNELTVTFDSPDVYAAAQRDRLGDLPGPNSATPEPFNFIRTMACNFGWDWGPVLTTSGIWKPIRLHAWSSARLSRVRPLVTVDDGVGHVRVEADVEHVTGTRPLTMVVRIAGRQAQVDIVPGETTATVDLDVPDVELWWPHTLGGQPLYVLDVALVDADGSALDQWSRMVGFRTIRLETGADELGTQFTLVVNDVPVFARGANWIPDDCFPSRVDADRYHARLRQTVDANIDLLRVWGGGIYEKDEFYDACDELGVLVWQDFLFACAAYPEEEPFGSEVEAEARHNVTRLMSHPSLALLNGNNENIWGSMEWGWGPRIDGRTWGKGYYLDLLPRVVAELDPTRPYWPGSPYSGTFDLPVNADDYGCSHIWDVWNQRDYPIYRSYVPRFVSEFGWQGPPTWATLTRAIHDDPLAPDSPGVLHHQKATGGNDKLTRGLAPHFPEPGSMDDWHWAMQLNQARALTLGIEHFRSHRGRTMGTVIWQINDCWPVTSWAAIDGDARRKPLWYALRRAYDQHLVTVQPRGSAGLHAVVVNDTRRPWAEEIVAERRTFEGKSLARWSGTVEVEPLATQAVPLPADLTGPSDPASELIVVTVGGRRATWFFAEDRDLAYDPPGLDVDVDGRTVRVTARTLVRDLALFADRLHPDAEVDDRLVTLLPGESHTFSVHGPVGELDAERVGGAPVLRCANDLVV